MRLSFASLFDKTSQYWAWHAGVSLEIEIGYFYGTCMV